MRCLSFCAWVVGIWAAAACGGSSGEVTGDAEVDPDARHPGVTTACGGAEGDPFSVVDIQPEHGAEGVDPGAQVFVTFSHPINMATIDEGSVHLASETRQRAVDFSHIPSTCTLIVTPDGHLSGNVTYEVTVEASVMSLEGEALPAPFTSSFTTAVYPATRLPPITLAEPPGGIYPAPQLVTLRCSDSSDGRCSATYFTLDGSTPTQESTRYTEPILIEVDTVLRFFSVSPLGDAEVVQTHSYVFDATPPSVTGHSPGASDTQVPLDATITVAFSEPMDPRSLHGDTVFVEPGVAGDITYEPAAHTVRFTPIERLACGTVHTVTVTTGATDLAGNALPSDHTWTFTSHDDCEPPFTTASVPGGPHSEPLSVVLSCQDSGGSGCARILYTLDGSAPTPETATVIEAVSTPPISIGTGETTLRYYAEDHAGQREVPRRQHYSISTSGFSFAAVDGIKRGAGKVPETLVDLVLGNGTGPLAHDPLSRRLYRATGSRLLVSDDLGQRWAPLANLGGHSPVGIAAHNEKFMAWTSQGILASVDGGATFTCREVQRQHPGLRDLIRVDHRVLIASDVGLWVSEDQGHTFELRTTEDGLGSNQTRALALSGGTLYVATNGGLSISQNLGETFVTRTTSDGLPSDQVRALAVEGSRVYAGTPSGLAVSSNGGTSFTVRTEAHGLGHDEILNVAVDGDRVYVGTGPFSSTTREDRYAYSHDGGDTFTNIPLLPEQGAQIRHMIVVDEVLHVSAYPSYYVSTDHGQSFTLRAAPTPFITAIRCHGGWLYAVASDSSGMGRLLISEDLGETFRLAGKEHGLASNSIEDLFVSDDGIFLATRQGVAISTDGGHGFVSRVGGALGDSGLAEISIASVYVEGAHIYAASFGIDRSTDLTGASFLPLGLTGSVDAVAVDGDNIYGGVLWGLQVSNDGGDSFAFRGVEEGLPDAMPHSLAVDEDGTLYVGTSGGLYVSNDEGASFSSTAVTDGVEGVVVQGTDVFVGSWRGALVSTDGGQSFQWLPGFPAGSQSYGGCFIP